MTNLVDKPRQVGYEAGEFSDSFLINLGAIFPSAQICDYCLLRLHVFRRLDLLNRVIWHGRLSPMAQVRPGLETRC